MTLPPTVRAMLDPDQQAPTAPLADFLLAYAEDDNLWWMISSGHHQNLFDDAVGQLEQLRQAAR